jgi:integrating conjugative element protein (TIGR03758 family)
MADSTSAVDSAFQAAAGNAVGEHAYFWVGFVMAILLLWAVWTAIVAYKGWAAGSITANSFGGTLLRALLIICITAAIFYSS